ncbi:mitochondrial mRNA pseudouridine synthase Trub2 [Anoplophora glabripennis]|uniref:mitochondrial mRNA pseudouridine synthase Trub2 n=1 Tax=Anoplophora glabripennis TaxID=217634 RepID=UPI0008745390|nr:mitochondrial mRNA pseudouridine synthase Trub2 [Anoplophora glabripennis]
MLTRDAELIWNTLKGIICVYKPAEVSTRRLRTTIINKICAELNEMDVRPPEGYVAIEGNPSKNLTVVVRPNYADHPLVVGPRYQEQDLPVSWSNYLGHNTSGVLIFGLRSGTRWAKFVRENLPTRAYRVKGVFGRATENGFKDGKVVERSTWRHIRQWNLERLLSSMQAAHQKKMFEMCGVDMQSQLAYDLAIKGPIRPINSKIPIIYGLKCVEFEPPGFTIEIQCINEYETYLKSLIHEIGWKLHSTAYCTAIKCIRHSCFTLDHALLMKHWDLQNIVTNIEQCNNILSENEHLLKQESVALR